MTGNAVFLIAAAIASQFALAICAESCDKGASCCDKQNNATEFWDCSLQAGCVPVCGNCTKYPGYILDKGCTLGQECCAFNKDPTMFNNCCIKHGCCPFCALEPQEPKCGTPNSYCRSQKGECRKNNCNADETLITRKKPNGNPMKLCGNKSRCKCCKRTDETPIMTQECPKSKCCEYTVGSPDYEKCARTNKCRPLCTSVSNCCYDNKNFFSGVTVVQFIEQCFELKCCLKVMPLKPFIESNLVEQAITDGPNCSTTTTSTTTTSTTTTTTTTIPPTIPPITCLFNKRLLSLNETVDYCGEPVLICNNGTLESIRDNDVEPSIGNNFTKCVQPCNVFGATHITTMDAVTYDFFGSCPNILHQQWQTINGTWQAAGLEISATYRECSFGQFSIHRCITTVTLKDGATTATFDLDSSPNLSYTFNGDTFNGNSKYATHHDSSHSMFVHRQSLYAGVNVMYGKIWLILRQDTVYIMRDSAATTETFYGLCGTIVNGTVNDELALPGNSESNTTMATSWADLWINMQVNESCNGTNAGPAYNVSGLPMPPYLCGWIVAAQDKQMYEFYTSPPAVNDILVKKCEEDHAICDKEAATNPALDCISALMKLYMVFP